MDMSELRAALEGHKNNPAVRAIFQLMHFRRVNCIDSAITAAFNDKPATFDLGGAQYMDQLFGEVTALVDGKPVPNGMEEWFNTPT